MQIETHSIADPYIIIWETGKQHAYVAEIPYIYIYIKDKDSRKAKAHI